MVHKHISPNDEVVLLLGAGELINEMVNESVIELRGSDPDTQVVFHSHIHQRYFNTLLVDFLSKTDRQVPIEQVSFLGGVRAICAHPNFDYEGSVTELKKGAEALSIWLNTEVEADVWLPSISIQAELKLSRLSFIKLCGNITKHSFLRSYGPAKELQSLLRAAEHSVTMDQALLALSDFYERFHTDILNYHASTIAEYLNDIRWGIYSYLQPQYRSSVVFDNENAPLYRYEIPEVISTSFAQACYWDLMNEVRSEPYMKKFQVTKWLKMRY